MFRYASLFLLVCLLAGCNGANDNADFQPLFEPFEFPDRLQSFVDSRDGETYHEVSLDTIIKWDEGSDTVRQTWMAENLKYFYVGNSGSNYMYNQPHELDYKNVYGLQYTYKEAITACPDGWHLPSDKEFMEAEKAFGFFPKDPDLLAFGPRGSNEGQKMKTDTDHWKKPRINNGNYDMDHFFILPSGYFSPIDSRYHDLGVCALFHTSTIEIIRDTITMIIGNVSKDTVLSDTVSIARHFAYYSSKIDRTRLPLSYRLSVRCVKNED